MKKQAHSITISVFVYEGEDEATTAETLTAFLPENFSEENVQIMVEEIKVLEGKDMTIFSVTLTKQRHIKYVIAKLKESLGKEQCQTIALQKNRVDVEGNFYLRLNRTKLEEEGETVVTDDGNCFHFKIVLAAYPKTVVNAITVAQTLFD